MTVFQQDGLQLPSPLLTLIFGLLAILRYHTTSYFLLRYHQLRVVVAEECVALHAVYGLFPRVVTAGAYHIEELSLRLKAVGRQFLLLLFRDDAQNLIRDSLHPHLVEAIADGDAVSVDAGGEDVYMVIVRVMVVIDKVRLPAIPHFLHELLGKSCQFVLVHLMLFH